MKLKNYSPVNVIPNTTDIRLIVVYRYPYYDDTYSFEIHPIFGFYMQGYENDEDYDEVALQPLTVLGGDIDYDDVMWAYLYPSGAVYEGYQGGKYKSTQDFVKHVKKTFSDK